MKRQKTREQAKLVSKLNAYIIPFIGLLFLYVAIEKQEWSSTSTILVLIAIFLLGYGLFRIYLIQKLMKDIESMSEKEYTRLQEGNSVDEIEIR